MLLALSSTETARLGASTQLCPDEFAVSGSDTTDDFSRGKTDVGAIEIGTDTCHLLGHLVLPEASVYAGIARLGAGIAGSDAFDGLLGMIAGGIEGMRFEHLFDVAHGFPFAGACDFGWPR